MKKFMLSFYFVICVIFLHGIWSEQRISSILPGNEVLLRTEIAESNEHEIVFYNGVSMSYLPLTEIEDYLNSWQVGLPVDSFENYLIGYRSEMVEQNLIMPVFSESDEFTLAQMTLASEDPSDDNNFTYQNLEIISDFVSFNDDKLSIGIKNVNGAYPTSESFTFFSYLGAITSPQYKKTDTIFALMYTITQPGIIEPGLYKIVGTEMDDLIKLADIDVSVDEGCLILSCDWQPLLDDEDFSEWFEPENPSIAFMSLTQKITLSGGTETADEGKSCLIFPEKNVISILENTTPQLDNLIEIVSEEGFYLELQYYDNEENFPVVSQIEFDNGQVRSFYPQSVDYSETVHYRTNDISDIVYLDDWSQAVIRFSDDNQNFIELIYPQTVSENTNLSELSFRVYPNPVLISNAGQTTIAFQNSSVNPNDVSIYNIKGQLVRSFSPKDSNSIVWNLRDNSNKKARSGIYFIKIQQNHKHYYKKLLLLP